MDRNQKFCTGSGATRIFYLFLLILVCVGQSAFAGTFIRSYGGPGDDYSNAIRPTSDGGEISGGSTASFGIDGSVWVIKLDSLGNITWQKAYGADGGDFISDIQQTSDGGYIVAGYTSSFGAGDLDAWVLRLDPNGNILWQKAYGDVKFDSAETVVQTPDGGFAIAGITENSTQGLDDGYVLRLDASGNIIWRGWYGTTGDDGFEDIQNTIDGGFILCGWTSGENANSEGWVVKLNAIGEIQFQKKYTGDFHNDYFSSIHPVGEVGYIVSGSTNSYGLGGSDAWVLRLDNNGNIVWQYTYGGKLADYSEEIQVTGVGRIDAAPGFIFTGETDSFNKGYRAAWIVDLDPSGNVTWAKTYGGVPGPDGFFSIGLLGSGGLIASGYTQAYGAGMRDEWIASLTGTGSMRSCSLIKSITVVPIQSFASAVDTNVDKKFDIQVIVTDTNVVPSTTHATVKQQCPQRYVKIPL